ncbi:hypothetical protein NAEGRDRAFT_59232 [Naegleria gruberi]|uniref:F-box domain-containing protein n=1 Tax=Naegleria gruberi TaxID=5762 RepID=D2VU84_NAEGR|nr:uncharacterized protein NAEGRDRAFT_59232 [Naegleria gruberi]EFC39646.1 hypothetical protein NAEGRDRAFT_59232 [Naegleria gruberi]|eukprot:XP_002672390.1 hypothetical protein NAEGRDRAFT_59232 [Naegleria gruberi strain NEG-M]
MVNELPQDIWVVILQFFTLDELLRTSTISNLPPLPNNQQEKIKLFGISKSVFSALIGCDIAEFNSQNNRDGGLFYRLLNEKLTIRQLDLVIDRIVNRSVFVNNENDYDEENNSHNYKPLLETQRNTGNGRRMRVRRHYYTRSRLNVLSNGSSMSKLRGELRKLIAKCNEQFPHIYEEYRDRIDRALKQSIKICTLVEKPIDNPDEITYEDNSMRRPNKPSFWDEEKRRKSIEINLRNPKILKDHQWRVQWAFDYSNHLRHELEFHSTYLRIYYSLLFKGNVQLTEDTFNSYMDFLEKTLAIVFKFDQTFQKKFFTERNLFKKKKSRYITYNVQPANQCKVDFIYQSISCLAKGYKGHHYSFDERTLSDETKQKVFKIIELLMDTYTKYYGNDTSQEYCYGRSIYDKLNRFDKIFQKYTSNNEINNLPKHLQQSFLFSCINYSPFVPVDLIKSLDFPLCIERTYKSTGTTETVSLCSYIILHNYMWNEETTFGYKEWLELLIDKFGKEQVVDSLKPSNLYSVSSMFHYNNLCTILGEKFMEMAKEAEKELSTSWNNAEEEVLSEYSETSYL